MEQLKAFGFALILLWLTLAICRRFLGPYGLGHLVPQPARLITRLGVWLVSREPSAMVRSRLRILPRHRDRS